MRRRDFARGISAATGLAVAVALAASARAAPSTAAPDFVLSDQNGHAFRLSRERGRPVVLFFGYTHCPDVCPTILANLKAARTSLGPKAADTLVALVTVDPERDTASELGRYVTVFDRSFLGLRGTGDQLARVYRAYHVRFTREAQGPNDYLVSHTAFVYYIGRDGGIRALGLWNDPQRTLVRSLESIADSKR